MDKLNRDFDQEQESGQCSYCGHWLRYTIIDDLDDGFYETCPSCDEYDQWGWMEDFWDDDDFIASQYPEGEFE